MAKNIDLLGQAAAVLSVVSFLAALALQIPAVVLFLSFFLAWLGLALQLSSIPFIMTGMAASGAVILILLGLATNVWSYKVCKDEEDGSGGNGGGPIG